MFCDLVGSTPLSTRYDPEDLREVIGAYHRCVTDTVARFDGFVAKYMGDGVLIYFGYPEAHEDDAERAVRAALAVIDAVGGLAPSERFGTHTYTRRQSNCRMRSRRRRWAPYSKLSAICAIGSSRLSERTRRPTCPTISASFARSRVT